jgi:ComF family protein
MAIVTAEGGAGASARGSARSIGAPGAPGAEVARAAGDAGAGGGGEAPAAPVWRPLDHLVHFFLPSPCLGCGAPLPAGRAPLALCPPCRGALRPAPAPACDGCGVALPAAALPAGFRCGACRARPPAFLRLVAPWSYAPPLDGVIRALKFGRLDFLGEDLAAAIFAGAPPAAGLAGCDLVVPVPLHWRRRLARGYNQAERIARPLARRLGVAIGAALARRRATPPQTTLGRDERRRNLRGAFAVRRPGRVRGRTVALVDDVVTTGATLDEAARCLLRAGAAAVVAVAAARRPAAGEAE